MTKTLITFKTLNVKINKVLVDNVNALFFDLIVSFQLRKIDVVLIINPFKKQRKI